MDYQLIREEEEKQSRQLQKQIQIQRQTNKFVGLINTGNLCYLNSTIQVIFSMPILCDQIIQYFNNLDKTTLNPTSLSFLKHLQEKKKINEGDSSKSIMDLSDLRLAFNNDLTRRHREKGNCFGMKQNDSSEFYLFLLEFLVKHGKNDDLISKTRNITNSDNPPSQIERNINKRNYSFSSSKINEFKQYFESESSSEQIDLNSQLLKLQQNLKGLMNPVEEYFFNGHILSYVGPCKYCNYESLCIQDFSIFELNFPERSSYFFSSSTADLQDMIKTYFKQQRVNSRCKNMKCKKHPMNVVSNKSDRTIYFDSIKTTFMINSPKILKFMFKKYEWSPFGGSRLQNQVEIPVVLDKKFMTKFYFQSGSVKSMDKKQDCLLQQIANNYKNYNYYLFSYSQQSGSLDSGHYVTHTLQYYKNEKTKEIEWYDTVMNDSSVSKAIYGGGLDKAIETDAYWVMYVREDQDDLNNQIMFNKAPSNMIKQNKHSWL